MILIFKRFSLILSLLFTLISLNSISLSSIENFYDNINSARIDFSQFNHWENINKEKKSQGTAFLKDNRFLLKYDQPDGQYLKVTNDKIEIFDPQMKNLLIKKTKFNLTNLNISYYLKKYKDKLKLKKNGDLSKIIITDTEESSAIIKIIITINNSNLNLKKLYYLDSKNNSVTYTIKSFQTDIFIPDKVFNIDLPEDVNIIKQN